jgi:transposase
MPERGRSRGVITTKILALTDALGNLVDFRLMPGQALGLRETDTLIRGLSAGHLLADKAFDADWLRNDLLERDIIPVILRKSHRKFRATFGKEIYRWRPLIENYFGKLKENRGIAMRSCKTDQSLHLHCGINHSNPVNANSP